MIQYFNKSPFHLHNIVPAQRSTVESTYGVLNTEHCTKYILYTYNSRAPMYRSTHIQSLSIHIREAPYTTLVCISIVSYRSAEYCTPTYPMVGRSQCLWSHLDRERLKNRDRLYRAEHIGSCTEHIGSCMYSVQYSVLYYRTLWRRLCKELTTASKKKNL